MKRRQFLRRFGIGAAVITVTPTILADEGKTMIPLDPPVPPQGSLMIDVASIPDGMTIDEIADAWRKTGTLIYNNSAPKLYVGENLYNEILKMCEQQIDPNLNPGWMTQIHSLNGIQIIKHPLLQPNEAVRTKPYRNYMTSIPNLSPYDISQRLFI